MTASPLAGSLGALIRSACEDDAHQDDPPGWRERSIITIENAGKWQTAYRYLSQRLAVAPETLDMSLEQPILWGGDEIHYVSSRGKAGLAQFKRYAVDLLQKHGKVFVLSAEKLSCLKDTPDQCIKSVLEGVDGSSKVTLIFKGALRENLSKFLSKRHNSISWKPMVVDTPDAAHPIDWDKELRDEAPPSLEQLRQDELQATLSFVQELVAEKLAVEGLRGSGDDIPREALDKILTEVDTLSLKNRLRERRLLQHKLLVVKLKGKLPAYSTKSGVSALAFYKDVLGDFASRFGLKPPDISVYSSNLYNYLKHDGDLPKLSKKHRSHD